jgi:hypothetical protein
MDISELTEYNSDEEQQEVPEESGKAEAKK